jgi:hypothetical protein
VFSLSLSFVYRGILSSLLICLTKDCRSSIISEHTLFCITKFVPFHLTHLIQPSVKNHLFQSSYSNQFESDSKKRQICRMKRWLVPSFFLKSLFIDTAGSGVFKDLMTLEDSVRMARTRYDPHKKKDHHRAKVEC